MTLLEWLQRHVWTRIDYPGGASGQCVDACNSYLREVLTLAPIRANAAGWASASHSGLVWTANGPENAPPPGAVVVWRGPSPQLGITALGHVAVVLAADPRVLLTADQNWAGRQELLVNVHGYDGVTGWLSPTPRAAAAMRGATMPDGKPTRKEPPGVPRTVPAGSAATSG